ncbi:MAG TPA: cytochrome P450 [Acidobacteriota bacterium]|nr:cytochrome P450 [Acidobacteriota bacterium]
MLFLRSEPRGSPIPGPRGHRLLGSLLEIRRNRLAFVRRALARYGDLVEFRMGPRRLLLVSRPSICKHVLADNAANYRKGLGLEEAKPLLGQGLLTSEGSRWQSQRRCLQPALGPPKLEEMSRALAPHAQAMLKRWEIRCREGGTVEMVSEMTRLTISLLGSVLFHYDLRAPADALARDLTETARWAMDRMTALVQLPMALPTPANLRVKRALRRLDRQAQGIIDHCRNQAGGLIPLLDRQSSGCPHAGRQLRDEVLTMLLAGQETTAATVAWTFYLLSRHPQVQAEVRREIETVLGERTPTVADVPKLSLSLQVIHEVLRLFPPVWIISRKALQDDRIEGHRISAGTDVLISTYGLQRNPRYWPQPDQFKPRRFACGTSSAAPWTYIPFGGGPRSCVGSRFGLTEALLVVVTVLRKFSLELVSAPDPLEEPLLTLRPRQPLLMKAV